MSDVRNLPSSTARFMGGDYGQLVIYKQGHIVEVLMNTCTVFDPPPNPDDPSTWLGPQSREDLTKDLESLQRILGKIEMGKYHQVVIMESSGALVPVRRKLKDVVCDLWAPRVRVEDLEWVKITAAGSYRTAAWKSMGVDVDVTMRGLEDYTADEVADDTNGHAMLDRVGLGRFTFPLVGHVVDDEGKVVGMMTEPVLGKRAGIEDRVAVYEAVALLQEHGLVLEQLWWSKVVMTPQGVKFPRLASLRELESDEQASAMWEAVDELFNEVDAAGLQASQMLCCSIQYEYEDVLDISVLPQIVPAPMNYQSVFGDPYRFGYLAAFEASYRFSGGKIVKRRGGRLSPRIKLIGGMDREMRDRLRSEVRKEKKGNPLRASLPRWFLTFRGPDAVIKEKGNRRMSLIASDMEGISSASSSAPSPSAGSSSLSSSSSSRSASHQSPSLWTSSTMLYTISSSSSSNSSTSMISWPSTPSSFNVSSSITSESSLTNSPLSTRSELSGVAGSSTQIEAADDERADEMAMEEG